MTPGIHPIPAADYHADPCPEPSLSSSIVRTLLARSPLHARHRHPRLGGQAPAPSSKFDLGTVAHAMLVEGRDVVRVIDASDWRTKAAQGERDEARASGRVPLLAEQYERVIAMVEVAAPYMPEPEPERTVIWQEYGAWCRARPDAMGDGSIIEYKTTKLPARPDRWQWIAWRLGYDVQIAWYLRGLREVTGRRWGHRVIVQEVDSPHALSVVEFDAETLREADERCDEASETWARCLGADSWPAYDMAVQTIGRGAGIDTSGLEIEEEED